MVYDHSGLRQIMKLGAIAEEIRDYLHVNKFSIPKNDILNSVKLINRYIDEIELDTGISTKNFILIGFSQGTMMILETLLSREKKISAVVGFSGGFLNVTNKISKLNLDTPILLIHGDDDNVVPMEMTKMACKNLNNLGYFVNTYFSKGLGHGISLDGLSETTKFLKKLIIPV